MRFTFQGFLFKNQKTGKSLSAPPSEWEKVSWIRIAGGFGIKLFLKNGQMYRFAGFKESVSDVHFAHCLRNKGSCLGKFSSLQSVNRGIQRVFPQIGGCLSS